MAAPEIDVAYVANLARLKLSAEETATFQKQLGDVLAYVAKLQEADISSVVAVEDEAGFENNLRPDAEQPSFTAQEALSVAPQQADGFFMVPRMVE
jgi:aspartyl-tRNA(Asn)/glutamyl-tRNA(Gln) amidotransferase subunit C